LIGSEIRNQKSEIRNQKSEIRNPANGFQITRRVGKVSEKGVTKLRILITAVFAFYLMLEKFMSNFNENFSRIPLRNECDL
jgi:hypothetical protein